MKGDVYPSMADAPHLEKNGMAIVRTWAMQDDKQWRIVFEHWRCMKCAMVFGENNGPCSCCAMTHNQERETSFNLTKHG